PGQEMVPRAQFRGANKRALWTLSGTASRVPEAGEDLELKMGDNWRRTGTVLAAVQLDDGSLMVQVVMNNDMEPDSVFRVRDDAGSLSIKPLPYSLEEN
ncbi:tRNA-modifying protein YgfZ, partial [Klebsiella pneumoniae]